MQKLLQWNMENIVMIVLKHLQITQISALKNPLGGAYGVMVIVVGNGHADTSSNPGQD